MKFEKLIILLPCHSIEDFPLHHDGRRAEGLLACWTALWHPAFIASAQQMPSWRRASETIDKLANCLIVVPEISEGDLPSGFAARAEKEGACLICGDTSRPAILAAALERLDGGDRGIDPELVADFLALGYCYLQVELLTRLMRYASSLDEIHFQDQLIAAAKAAATSGEESGAPSSGDAGPQTDAGSPADRVEAARSQLRRCFDTLSEERDHYYPADSFLLDLTVVAATTMGPSLRRELAAGLPLNVLLSADSLVQMARDEPESLAMLREAVAQERVTIVGGDFGEPEFPLMSAEQVLGNLRRGEREYVRYLGARPTVFGRRRFGLTPLLPQVLKRCGFTAALHATLDDGKFPAGTQARTQWEGLDGTQLSAIARVPLDASRPETFLKFSATMGEYLDSDHVAVTVLAHWPGGACPWYDDLRRISRYVGALGKMITCQQLFRDTERAGQTDRFTFDQYRSPYLSQEVQHAAPDPISRHVRAARQRALAEACQSLKTAADLLEGHAGQAVYPLLQELDGLGPPAAAAPDGAASGDAGGRDPAPITEERLVTEVQRIAQTLADQIPRSGGAAGGCLVFNPLSYSRRIGVELPAGKESPAVGKPVVAAGRSKTGSHAVVDVPAMGFSWLGSTGQPDAGKRLPKPLAEEGIIRNEFLEVRINPDTGSIRSVYDYHTRGNRFSQQVGFRGNGPPRESNDPGADPEELADYSVMAADAVEVTAATPALGEITTRGRLLSRDGKQLAQFAQKYQLWRGSRVVWLTIDLQPQVEPLAQAWRSYFACRFAWSDGAANLYRSLHGCRRPTQAKRLETPEFIEIESAPQRMVILTGGLPYHRRIGHRMLDTLLIVKGETARRFRLGVGFDIPHPHQEALGMLVDPILVESGSGPPAAGNTSWMFHLDAKNVVATRWEPLFDGGKTIGYRVRLLETAGRQAKTRLRSFRQVTSARLVDFRGEQLRQCQVEEDAVLVEMGPFQWAEIEATW